MAIISSLAACLLLLISSFSLAENRNSVSASDSLWLEIQREKSFALGTAESDSNITITPKLADNEHLLRERALHNMRTGIYTTEVEKCLSAFLVSDFIKLLMVVNSKPKP